jgi:four helix bundle protein
MATIKSFEDLEVWQLSRELAGEIYELSFTGAFGKDYDLKRQINNSGGSIMENIAEGFERGGNREFIQFLGIAKGSCGETRSQLYRAFDRKHITNDQFQRLADKSIMISKKINSLIRYLNTSDMKGMKFHEPETPYSPEPENTKTSNNLEQ